MKIKKKIKKYDPPYKDHTLEAEHLLAEDEFDMDMLQDTFGFVSNKTAQEIYEDIEKSQL